MTVVRYIKRENKLGKLIGAHGGIRVHVAIDQADANVGSLHDTLVVEIDRLLAVLASSVSAAAHGDDVVAQRRVYEDAKALAGIAGSAGLEGVGKVAYSLCELSDRYIHGRRWNPAAIGVHLGAMQVLRDPNAAIDDDTRASVLDGLAEVVRRAEAQAQNQIQAHG